MTRPADWTPLAAADPVPGDPAALHDEARHLRDVAHQLRQQAAELRHIAHADDLTGQYADQLRSGAGDLEHHLRQVAERYEHVHGHLTGWAGELDDMQSESLRLLHSAQRVDEETRAAARHTPTPPPAHHDDPLRPHRQSLHRLTAHRDDRAARYAARIRSACDDVIKDSWWERTSDDISAALNNTCLSRTLDTIGAVVSLIGIIALFCTPAGWIITACTAIGFALVAKDVLAATTGAGSWFDVALDTVGFLGGFAFGRALATLKQIRIATKAAAVEAAADEAATRIMREARSELDDTYSATSRHATNGAARARARQARSLVRGRANAAGRQAGAAEHARPVPRPNRLERAVAGGAEESASHYKDVNDMCTRYPHNAAVQNAGRNAGTVMAAARGVNAANFAIGDGGQILGDTGISRTYNRVEERTTVSIGTMFRSSEW